MGQFSFLYADTDNKKAMLDDVEMDSYLLVPPPFQSKYGKYIKETCYDGYGNMGGYDVYDLIIEWNKDFIPTIIKQRNGKNITGREMDIANLMAYYEGREISCPLRYLGIDIACYDEDNASLPFPIKIASRPFEYNSMPCSESDPNQGWGGPKDNEEDEGSWYEQSW